MRGDGHTVFQERFMCIALEDISLSRADGIFIQTRTPEVVFTSAGLEKRRVSLWKFTNDQNSKCSKRSICEAQIEPIAMDIDFSSDMVLRGPALYGVHESAESNSPSSKLKKLKCEMDTFSVVCTIFFRFR